MNKNLMGMIGGLSMVVISVLAFVWLWSQTRVVAVDSGMVMDNLQPVDVQSLENSTKELIEGLENNAGMPIPVPIDKMGRDNPFANY
ncbi:MAG: hypothetical protein BWY68_00381 [bacterium ADurb.Bin400]|nr:MAG: hypothetical protein BWY68_00381 [bacterium ADurb.Bin400]